MSQFVLVSTHTPEHCPYANSRVRSVLSDPHHSSELAKRLGIEVVVGPLVSAEHRTFSVIEAPGSEVVQRYVVESGLIQWTSTEVIPVMAQEEALKEMVGIRPWY